jgi:hypothetical protein
MSGALGTVDREGCADGCLKGLKIKKSKAIPVTGLGGL